MEWHLKSTGHMTVWQYHIAGNDDDETNRMHTGGRPYDEDAGLFAGLPGTGDAVMSILSGARIGLAAGMILALGTACADADRGRDGASVANPTATTTASPTSNGHPTSDAHPTLGNSPAPTGTSPAASPVEQPKGPEIWSSRGTRFVAPLQPTNKPYSTNCDTLIDSTYTVENCLIVTGKTGAVAGLVEYKNSDERDLVYRRIGNTWSLALRFTRVRTIDASERLGFDDLMDDGAKKLVFVRPAGERIDSLDVVESTGKVSFHQSLSHGQAQKYRGGGIESWTMAASGRYDHRVIRYEQGHWVTIKRDRVEQSQLPPSGTKASSNF